MSEKETTYEFIRSSSEQEWLEARQRMITATDAARLCAGGPVIMERIKEEKKRPPEPLFPTKALEFGHEREPHIIDYINATLGKDKGFKLEHNIDVGFLKADPRKGGTPDAIDEKNKIVGECKTFSGTRTEVPKDHFYQCMWNIYIFNADYCVYAVEEHVDFVPQQTKLWVIERDEDVIADMVAKVEEFFEAFPVEASVDEELDSIIEAYAAVLEEEKSIKERKAALQDRVRTLKGALTVFGYVSDHGSISASFHSPRFTLDTKAIQAEHPEIAEKYGKYSERKLPTLKISPVKKKDEPKK